MVNKVYNSPLKSKHLTSISISDYRTRNSAIEEYNKNSSKKAVIGSIGKIKENGNKQGIVAKGTCGPYVIK